ncbi:MAG: bifunctional glutamate N-acetyltransferase/amino-acid acetyltransferase ArgJ [Planctomycetes bacterium]|nr:bifunctional glutamate N-acetyltransferase/amino-acid acetyltransferase ArgJ [Planctomycetota bacterium]
MTHARHITLPAGFVAGAVRCGLKSTQREDLAIIAAGDGPVPAAVVTTRNQVVGAPVRWCRSVLPRGYGRIRGVVVNAGNSNVCNGKRGDRDAAAMASMTAGFLGGTAEEVLVCSTGIIGHPMPMDKVRQGIAAAAGGLSAGNDAAVAAAIMTTDTRPKSAVVQGRIGGKLVTVAGIAKGAGMIAPSLATMLSFITTDAALRPAALGGALKAAVEPTFNAVTIDSDTSTSDTVIVMASGAAGNAAIAGGADLAKFARLLTEVCAALAEMIARDGEGATKLLRVTVRGARTDADARTAAKAIANSPLMKCAVHGGDPNWGRVLMAAGKSGAAVDQDRATCKIGPVTVMRRGTSCPYDTAAAEAHMAGDTVEIDLNLALGKGRFTALTCDLSREYVAINADYHT